MRFTDGLWRRPEGVRFDGALEVVEVIESSRDRLRFIASTRPVTSRGATLNCKVDQTTSLTASATLITVEISSPLDDCIRVRIDHHKVSRSSDASDLKGVEHRGPAFELFPDGLASTPKTSTRQSDSQVVFTSGSTTVSVNTEPRSYALEFAYKSEPLTSVGHCGHAVADIPTHLALASASEKSFMSSLRDTLEVNDHAVVDRATNGSVRYMLTETSLGVGETIYGLGERFGSFVKNGQNVQTWQADGGTDSELAYKNVPFYISSKGYGVFVNHSDEVDIEVGREKTSRVGISVRGERLEYIVIGGGSMKQVLSNYTRLTGRPPVPPAWSFGLYLSTSFTTDYDEKTVRSFLQGMKDRKCPVRVFHLDCFWMKRYEWCSFKWDADSFPDPKKYLQGLKDDFNVKICAWVNPYIGQRADIFDEGCEKGYFIKRTNGSVFQWDEWQPGTALVDFTNPDAYIWYAGLIKTLLETGVDTIKTDFGERVPHLGVVYHNGADPYYYTHLYNKCVFDAISEIKSVSETVLFARSATAGGQRFPVHWGGDSESTYEAMAGVLRGGLSLALCGFGFWSHDIGGFEGTPPEELFCRWVAFGLFSSHSRLHGSTSYRVPWIYGDQAVKITGDLTRFKMRLMPYIYAEAIKTHQSGIPMMRPMVLEFPDDPTCQYLDCQYMFGPSLLVAPVFHNVRAQLYLPAGAWTCLWTDTVVQGPRWVMEDVPLDRIPVYVRANSVLLLGPEDVSTPDYAYSTVPLEVRTYQLADAVTVDVPKGAGSEELGQVEIGADGTWNSTSYQLRKR